MRPKRCRLSNLQKQFGERVRALRESNDMTQEQLAEVANIASQNIARIERGERFVSAKSLERLASALLTSVDELFKFNQRLTKSKRLDQIAKRCTPKQLQLVIDIATRILRD